MKNLANKLDKIAKESDDPKMKDAIRKKKAILSNDKPVRK